MLAAASRTDAPTVTPGGACRVLLVDDDPAVLASYARVLRRDGYQVITAQTTEEAAEALRAGGIDVVITDMHLLHGRTGLEVLDVARTEHANTPVLFLTGATEIDLAVQALERGALRWLMKPVAPDALRAAIESARRVAGACGDPGGAPARELANLDVRLDAAIEGLTLVCQPICRWSTRKIEAFEVLMRTREASLRRPDRLLAAAERLGRLHDVGRAVRSRAAAFARTLTGDVSLHVNLHPLDLEDPELYDPGSPLAEVATCVVLELTERVALEKVDDVAGKVAALRRLGYRIALDDLGGGYASLGSVAELRPDAVKLDLSICQGIAADDTRRALVDSVRALCARTGIDLVCEGVEKDEDLAALVAIGCDLFQGHLFARPAAQPAEVPWERLGGARPAARGTPAPELGRTVELGSVGDIAVMLAREAAADVARIRADAGRIGSADPAHVGYDIAARCDQAATTLAALLDLVEKKRT